MWVYIEVITVDVFQLNSSLTSSLTSSSKLFSFLERGGGLSLLFQGERFGRMNRHFKRLCTVPIVTYYAVANDVFLECQEERVFTPDEIRRNDGTLGKPSYITFRGGVHDITNFRKLHPGGKCIDQAAGGDVEGFWNVWAYHYLSQKVKDTLEETRVGTIINERANLESDCFEEEPYREDAYMKPLTLKPYCSETLPIILSKHYLTPAEALYIRNHAPVPMHLEYNTHFIDFTIEDNDSNSQSAMSLRDLCNHFKRKKVVSVIQCAGNRAADDIKATGPSGFSGSPFESIDCGMVGNVLWTGFCLSDVLKKIYPNQCRSSDQWHVIFTGADGYDTSVPLTLALDPVNDAIIATHMNDQPLSPDHGYPVRVVVPGVAGARSVKWLESVTLSRSPSNAPWNSYYYRHADGRHIQYLPLQSLILSPSVNEEVKVRADDVVQVSGVAYCGGGPFGGEISGVDVSTDDGRTWIPALLMKNELCKDDSHSFHGWVRFIADVKVNTAHNNSVCCRAYDSRGNVQPRVSTKQRGYLYNGWHTVDFTYTSARE